ncbi:MAG: 50S ribosomal protein L4 [Planctomycetota bacterium]|nr:50S ribosomal protein L4 [Planctomycetota bacterium]
MAALTVYGKDGKAEGRLEIDDGLLPKKVNFQILHEAIVMYEANRRSGTHSAKTRGEVAGSSRKPWVQKGTGRARAGCRRSPIWRGGAVVHGPVVRDYSWQMPKKAVRKAFLLAVAAKLKDDEVRVVSSLAFEKPKTKEMVNLLRGIGVERGCLVAVGEGEKNAYLSARNIEGVSAMRVQEINAYDVLRHRYLVLSKDGFSLLCQRLGIEQQEGKA